MRLKIQKLGRIEVPRNDVLQGYKAAYINTLLQTTRFKNRFLQYWDGQSSFSMFYHANREDMTRLLGMHNQFDGETDLAKTKMNDGLKDVLLQWTIKPEKATESLKDDVILNIKQGIVDAKGYTVKYTNTDEPMFVDGVELTNDMDIAVYSLIIKHIANGMGTYTFTWVQVETYLRDAIFNNEKITLSLKGGRLTRVKGVPMLASYGVASVDYGTNTNMLSWNGSLTSLTVDTTKLQALDPDEFMEFVGSYLDFRYVEDDKEWWEELLQIVLVILTIVAIVVTLGAAGAAVSAASSAASMAGATAASVATAAVSTLAAYGVSTLAFGMTAGLLIGAANIYGAIVSIQALGGVEQAEEAVQAPKEIKNKVAMSDELRWTYCDSDKPEAQILNRLNEGKP